jgi:hypothetical protein
MKLAIETISGGAVRAMRDRVYGTKIKDAEWETVGPHWMQPKEIAFLEDQCARLDLKDAPK